MILDLTGTLPDEFGLYFPAVIECLLPGNNFTGNIPSTVGNMTMLTRLNLAENEFSGQIPKSIGSLSMLQFADFSGNSLASIEKGTFKCQSLEVLILASNKQLTMRFDASLELMEPLYKSLRRFLNISACHFLGIIPAKLWFFQSLISVDLSHNRLSGRLPCIAHCPRNVFPH